MTEDTQSIHSQILAMDIGGTKISGALVHLKNYFGTTPIITYREEVPTDATEGGRAVLQRVLRLALHLISASHNIVSGIAVGTAGVVSRDGIIVSATNAMPSWEGIHLSEALSKTTGLPVTVLGDVHAHALGEYIWGAGKGRESMLLVAVGTGIGSSMISDGAVMWGAHGFGGHLGHMFHPSAQGIRCACGQYSHVESIASGLGIEHQYARLTGTHASGKSIAEHAADANPVAARVLNTAGHSLGNVLGAAVNILDPDCVVLSGSVCHAGAAWLSSLRQGYAEQAMVALSKIPIMIGRLGGDAPLLGAAAMMTGRCNEASDGFERRPA